MAGPIGIIKMYASTMIDPSSGILSVPESWLLCDGRSYSKTEYSSLYRTLLRNPSLPFDATTNPLIYGGDDENFNVPNLVNRFVRGWNPEAVPARRVGENVQESVKLDTVSAQANLSGLTFGNNQPYSLTEVSVGSAGRHNHRYATSNQTDTGRAELLSTQGFFHSKPEEGIQEQGANYVTHVRPQDHGNTGGSPCNLHRPADKMHSIAQQFGDSILEPSHEGDTPNSWNYRPFKSIEFFGTGNGGYPYNMPGYFINRGSGSASEIEKDNQRWRWGNTNFRHNHKYNLVVNSAGGHTHSISMTNNDSHTHIFTVNPVITKTATGSSFPGAELRPFNTKLVYIIYTGVK